MNLIIDYVERVKDELIKILFIYLFKKRVKEKYDN